MPRKRSVCAIAAAALLAVAVGCTDTTDATSADPQFAHSGAGRGSHWVAQVAGGTQGFDDDFGADRDVNYLGIQAKLFSDGSASGTIQASRLLVHPPGIPGLGVVARLFNLHGRVLCMDVNGNRAWLGGVVTKGEIDAGLLGGPFGTIVDATGLLAKFWFVVNDDGTVDGQLAAVANLDECTVQDDPPIPFFNTTNGNLRIMDRR